MPVFWTALETICVLDHIETHKGPKSLYITDKNSAIREAKEFLDDEVPDNEIDGKKITNKLGKIRQRWLKKGMNPYLAGWAALKDEYSREHLLREEGCDQAEKRLYQQRNRASVSQPRKRQQNTHPDADVNTSKAARLSRVSARTPEIHDTPRRNLLDTSQKLDSYVPRSNSPLVRPTPPGNLRVAFEGRNAEQSEVQLSCTIDDRNYLDRVQNYLKDPEKHIPTIGSLQELRDGLIEDIHDAVCELLGDTYTADDKSSHLGELLSVKHSKPIASLCRTIYGASTEEELIALLRGPCLRSQLDLEPFLRTAIAAAVYEWVLQEQHCPLPRDQFDLSGMGSVYSDVVSRMAPELHEQFLRESRQIFVNDHVDPKPYASSLAFRLIDTLTPFLKINLKLNNFDEMSMTKWNQRLLEIFKSAIRFSLQVSMLNIDSEFRWPKFDDRFDISTMTSADGLVPSMGVVVQAVFFPSLWCEAAQVRDRNMRTPILLAQVQATERYDTDINMSGK